MSEVSREVEKRRDDKIHASPNKEADCQILGDCTVPCKYIQLHASPDGKSKCISFVRGRLYIHITTLSYTLCSS